MILKKYSITLIALLALTGLTPCRAYTARVPQEGDYFATAMGRQLLPAVADQQPLAMVPDSQEYYIPCIAAAGPYACITDSSGRLRVFDVSNPAAPVETALIEPGFHCEKMVMVDRLLFIAAGMNGLQIVDISNPAVPAVIGFVDTPDFAGDVAITGSYACVANMKGGLRIIDISNPANPKETGFAELDPPGEYIFLWNMAVCGSNIYVGDGMTNYLHIFHISNSGQPIPAGKIETPEMNYNDWQNPDPDYYFTLHVSITGIAVTGSRVYVSLFSYYMRSSEPPTVCVTYFNLENPSLNWSGPTMTLYLFNQLIASGYYTFLLDEDNNTIHYINVGDSGLPKPYIPGSVFRAMAIDGAYLYLTYNGDLTIVAIPEEIPDAPAHLTAAAVSATEIELTWDSPQQNVTGFTIERRTGTTGVYSEIGSAVFGVSSWRDQGLPPGTEYYYRTRAWNHAGSSNYSNEAGAVTVRPVPEGNLVMTGHLGGIGNCNSAARFGKQVVFGSGSVLMLADASDPWHPVLKGQVDIGGPIQDIDINGQYAGVVVSGIGFRMVDLTVPNELRVTGSILIPGGAKRVAFSGSSACVLNANGDLYIVSISTPSAPQQIGFFKDDGFTRDMAVSGSHVYLASSLCGLRIVDISDPSFPHLAGTLNKPGEVTSVAASGGYAFISSESEGLLFVDITNPSSPLMAGSFFIHPAERLAVRGTQVYVTAETSMIIDYSNLAAPSATLAGVPRGLFAVDAGDSYVYAACGHDGLRIYDVSRLTFPEKAGMVVQRYPHYGLVIIHSVLCNCA